MKPTLTKYAAAIKAELAMDLQKHGSSLEQFEQSLKEMNTGEGVFKIAVDQASLLQSYANLPGMNFMTSLPEMAFKTSLAGGAVTGLAMDEMDSSVDNLNKSLEREREKVKLVRRITANLRREHGIQ